MASQITTDAGGVFIVSVTPFDAGGGVDTSSLQRLVDFYLAAGVSGITVLGMMGEAQKMTPQEARDVTRTVLDRVAGRIPVVVGVSGGGLNPMAQLTRDVMAMGAAGVMVAPMPSLKTDEAIYDYYAKVADHLGDTPIVLQDFPQSTGVHMSIGLIDRIAREIPSVTVLKHEDCPGLTKITRLRELAARPGGRRLSILVGNGGLYYPQELGRGADGAMTGFAFPEMLVRVHELYQNDPEAAEDLYDAYLPLVRHEQQPGFGLAVRKHLLYRRGVIADPSTRAPGPRLSETDIAELDGLWARLEKKLATLEVT